MNKRLKKKKGHEIIRHVKTLKVDKGDLIIVSINSIITGAVSERIVKTINNTLPNNKVFVFDGGMKISVIKKSIQVNEKVTETDINKATIDLLKDEKHFSLWKRLAEGLKGVGGI